MEPVEDAHNWTPELVDFHNYGISTPNFAELAESYPPLKPYILLNPSGIPYLNFKDASAQRRLTEALLKRDFGLSIVLPENRLCPAVPNRLNYVLWIQDIVKHPNGLSTHDIRGIDIGTGASAIYALLSCRIHEDWSIIGTDVDDFSLRHAAHNVLLNGLQHRIEVRLVAVEGPILQPLVSDPLSSFYFTMCNPPFYSSAEDILQSAALKEFDPSAVCTGSDVEMITPGGEVAFVSRMVKESLSCGDRCRWFTSMLGKLSSITALVHVLREEKIENYGLKEFIQGHTRRWGLVWSHGDMRLPDSIVRPTSRALQGLLPPPGTLQCSLPPNVSSPTELRSLVMGILKSITALQISHTEGEDFTVVVTTHRNTWSRGARRKQIQLGSEDLPHHAPILMQCRITGTLKPDNTGLLTAVWTIGKDRAAFESFWNHVKRKVEATSRTDGDVVME